MFSIKCKCGARSMMFKINIGDFYIDECCKLAGFDHLGNWRDPHKKPPKPKPPRRNYEKTGRHSQEGKALRKARIAEERAMRAEKKAKKVSENDPTSFNI